MIDSDSYEAFEEYRAKYGPGPFITCDAVVTRGSPTSAFWDILLITRKKPPFTNRMALPGGFMEATDFNVIEGTMRECFEETNLDLNRALPVRTIIRDGVNRDPRARMVAIATYFRLPPGDYGTEIRAQDDASSAKWYDVRTILALGNINFAFDHGDIIRTLLS